VTEHAHRRELERILSDLVDELDVPPSKYEDAKSHYEAVGNWLNDDGSELSRFRPEIYPQGSFALGTAVRPLGNEEYDVDSVCLLKLRQVELTQQALKEMVGKRLKAHATYARMLDPKEGGRRCWTLKYADESKFHLDILPAIPDDYGWLVSLGVSEEYARHSICITDKKSWIEKPGWPRSNPQGYVGWFKDRMRVILEEQRRIVAMDKRADVQQVPDYEVRTPLQRLIQLLKRHRDIRYNGDEDKPLSIIITTLAAQGYNNEAELIDAISNVVPRMRQSLIKHNEIWWVPNPVNPSENFADKWAETPRKAGLFFDWLDAVEHEHGELLTDQGFGKVEKYLSESYGAREAAVAMTKYSNRSAQAKPNNVRQTFGEIVASRSGLPSRFEVPHRERPRWPIAIRANVRIAARASRQGFRTINFNSDSQPLPKQFSLRFEASTNVPGPFDVYWQVVNTGEEATRANGLRGSIFLGDLVRTESTLYKGTHWIECFIVKDGKCIARSGEFVVNVE
jgi:hypothetical protein